MQSDTSFAGALPAGPPGHPIAHTWGWMRRPIELMTGSRAEYGRRFTLRFIGDRSFVFLHHADDVKAAFGASPDALLSGRANRSFIPFFGRHNLMSLDGEQHRRHRRLMMPPFRGEPLATYLPLIEQITREAIATWPEGETFSLHERMRRLTLTVIVQAIFGVRDAPRVEAIRGYVHRMVGGVGARLSYLQFLQRDLGPLSPWGRFLRTRGQLIAVLQQEIDALRDAGTGRDDVLARLIEESRLRGDPMSDEELHHELLSLLAAGHETSATALSWAFQNLLPDRDRLARARDEVSQNPGEVHPDKLPFLSAIVAETLRLMPPIPIVVRYVSKPVDIAGWSPPVGTFLAPCAYLAHREAEVFPEPDAFVPERFLDVKHPPWVYFPYGGGSRLCLGATFANFEMVNILATVLRSVDLTLMGPPVVKPAAGDDHAGPRPAERRCASSGGGDRSRAREDRKPARADASGTTSPSRSPRADGDRRGDQPGHGLLHSFEALALHSRLAYTWRALGAAFTGYAMSLLFRIYDELKDVETDRRLAAAGDPKYMERPIVRGLVDVEDLHALQWAALGDRRWW